MNARIKKSFPYLAMIICCFTAFLITRSALIKKTVEKEIVYTSATASEVYMVWGINYLKMPPKDLWPSNSFEKNGLVYTKMRNGNGRFTMKMSLPYHTLLNYWMLQKKDKNGNETDKWDAGGHYNKYFSLYFNDEGILKPGYFIFLAGLLPLLLFYFKNRDRKIINNIAVIHATNEYIPQFDSIRAIAVLLVIVHHWFTSNKILNFLPNGPLGVNIFFVLSGFLITGILLRSKKQIEEQGLKRSVAFRNFYIRRTLRIFPIYYLVLVIFWILNDPALKDEGVYYFTYTSNYLFYAQQFFPPRFAHLWSLAVEEQFYIIWPWLIILVNKKYLPYLVTLFIIIGISSNYIFTSNDWWVQILTPACFDAFAIGGLLSYLIAYEPNVIDTIRPKFKWIFCLILLLFALDIFDYSFLPARTTHAFLAIAIIYYCLFKRNNRIINSILNNKWLIRIGKISYGIYLYHLFVPELWNRMIKEMASLNIDILYNEAMPEGLKPGWLLIQHFSFLLLICVLSWKYIEKPIMNLKSRFENKIPVQK